MSSLSVLVTRPELQSRALARILSDQGFTAIVAPMIEIRPLEQAQLAVASTGLTQLKTADAVIFVSRNAFHFFTQICAQAGIDYPASTAWYAIGDATAEAMIAEDLIPVTPEAHYDSESLLSLETLQQVRGESLIVVAGLGGRRQIEDTLRDRGANVSRLELYRREPVEHKVLKIDGEPDVMTAMSGETVQSLAGHVKLLDRGWLKKPLFVPSARAAQVAFDVGFQRVRVTQEASTKSLLEALCRYRAEV